MANRVRRRRAVRLVADIDASPSRTSLAVAWSIAPKDVLGVALLPVPLVALLSKLLLDYRSRREERSRRVAEASIDDTGRQALNSRRARPRGPTRPRRRS